MDVARDRKSVIRLVLLKQFEKTFPLVRDVAPVLHALFMGEHLNATTDDTDVSRNLELFVEPLPLRLTQKGLGGIVSGHVPSDGSFRFRTFRPWQFVAEVTGVEQQDLAHLSGSAEGVGTVNPSTFAPRRIGWVFKKIEEDPLRLLTLFVGFPPVVDTVVVIVPGRDHGGVSTEFAKSFNISEFHPLLLQKFHILGVAVDVVAEENKSIWLVFPNRVKHRSFPFPRIAARAEGDFLDDIGLMKITLHFRICGSEGSGQYRYQCE